MHLRSTDGWSVESVPHFRAKKFALSNHYMKSISNTSSHCFALFKYKDVSLYGISVWMVAPYNVAKKYTKDGSFKDVLTLSRFAIAEGLPTNSASFLLGRSIRLLKSKNRYSTLVTYADTSEGHKGTIYKATNWIYDGITYGKPKWIDKDGNHVSQRAKVWRSKREMQELYTRLGHSKKIRFYYPLPLKKDDRQLRLLF